MNYQLSSDSFVTTMSIFESFQNSFPDKENVNLNVRELGIIINQVFPSAVRTQKRVDGKRIWHYPFLRISGTYETDLINWENLGNFKLQSGWHLSDNNNNFVEWIKIPSQDLCNGNRVIKEIKIFKDWTLVVRVNNRDIKKETLGLQKMEPSREMISYLFRVLDEFVLCKGFPVDSKIITRDTKGNVTGETEEWHSPADVSTKSVLFHRSTSCSVLHQANYKRSSQVLCDHCSLLKRNSSVPSESSGFVEKKRESYMSEVELKEKLRRVQARRKSAERRTKYLQNKIEKEMKIFEDEDHEDFLVMFQRVEKDSLSDDMKIFFESQEKALAQKNQKGNRWHPK